MNNPYEKLPDRNFWKPSVANKNPLEVTDLWKPKFKINERLRFVTYGSCFAQHIGKALSVRNFNWKNYEVPPPQISSNLAKEFSYGVFSSRTGNIYTTSLFKQWIEWSLNLKKVPDEYWEKNGRIYDPFRPRIEPKGFASIEEMYSSRRQAISAFGESIKTSQVIVFTLGLTESWVNKETGYEYPMCPGTAAGIFDAEKHVFENQSYSIVYSNLLQSIRIIKGVNPKVKFILTVSPVPLTATNTHNHVLVSSMYSKSVLRAVAGELATSKSFIDYFPSYEYINAPSYKGMFFEPNLRGVSQYGVNFVMDCFFSSIGEGLKENKKLNLKKTASSEFDAVCDEEILESFKIE